jgi:hypothetical protein
LGAFNGSFNGLGHSISNLYINNDNQYIGLFSKLGANSVVSNLNISQANVTGNGGYIGILAGSNSGTINNVSTSGSVNTAITFANNINPNPYFIPSYPIGGLVGENLGNIKYSSSAASITGKSLMQMGGLVGINGGAISNSSSSGNIYQEFSSSNWDNSGLSNSLFQDFAYNDSCCFGYYFFNTSSTNIGPGTGGLVGVNIRNSLINNSSSSSALIAGKQLFAAGVLAGANVGTILDSYSSGSISAGDTSQLIGGLIGINTGQVDNSYSTASILVGGLKSGRVGGLVGISTWGSENGAPSITKSCPLK